MKPPNIRKPKSVGRGLTAALNAPCIRRYVTSRFQLAIVTVLVISVFGSGHARAADKIEFVNGTELDGKILQIRKADKEFDFETDIGGRTISRTYPYDKVHAVTFGGKRFVITPKTAASTASSSASSDPNQLNRSRGEVLQIIEQAGRQPPSWLASTPMNHPASLDLSWPLKPGGPWNESKNVGQYIWGRVNPNPGRWRSGIKLVHQCIDQHKTDPKLLKRDFEKLGQMYFELLQDYPRAAYYMKLAGAAPDKQLGVHLAECYWRLGNKSMALQTLAGRSIHFDAIKLLGDMGEVDRAVRLTAAYANSNFFNEAFLNAGDALRNAGRYDEAIQYYQRILDLDRARNAEYKKRYHGRARDAIQAIRLFDKVDVTKISDGTYQATATAYAGPLTVDVIVADAKIESVQVVKHKDKQFYAALTDTPRQIIEKQTVKDIDGTSGATITSQAIITATAMALGKGSNQ
ncbi:FMN-binding protein [Crateriforma conspicua]|uniref:FMN-binding protein n=1 Tax=Crateriforma conspicua TaxID=2527996 RepID=UPI001187D15B|nr:FMN-binding protein [Crateriforma conspicua]QDV64621.1 FMN-binding domain protein [Crateriforma conspicua]